MSYVIMNLRNEQLHKGNRCYSFCQYATISGARSAATRLNKKIGEKLWNAISYSEYDRLFNTEVEVTNLMSGKTCKIRKSDRGGRCDPSTETYWSM